LGGLASVEKRRRVQFQFKKKGKKKNGGKRRKRVKNIVVFIP
jgi:hypothetical protein